MRPIDVATNYMEIFYSGNNIEELRPLLSDGFTFEGPFYFYNSANDYLETLIKDPPKDMSYELIKSFETGNSVCLIYKFTKPTVSVTMAQLFEIEGKKISKIILIFDTKAFC